MALFAVAGGILFISSLGFIGYSVPPPNPELGGMLMGGYPYVLKAPWLVLWPGIALALLLWIWVMAGDTLTERFGFRSKAIWSKMVE